MYCALSCILAVNLSALEIFLQFCYTIKTIIVWIPVLNKSLDNSPGGAVDWMSYKSIYENLSWHLMPVLKF